jgi:YesN/AraC family two-component response regulator
MMTTTNNLFWSARLGECDLRRPQTKDPLDPMKNILIVDDDAVFLHALEEMIRLVDGTFRVYTAGNGEQAAVILASTPVDLMITDLRMPVMSGQELILRSRETHPDLPIIVVSACGHAPTIRELGKPNCRFFDKPINMNELVVAMQELIL